MSNGSRPPWKPSARDNILAQWRGFQPLDEARETRPAVSLESLMPRVLSNLGLDRKRAETEILKVWNHLIDPVIVKHAQPTGLWRGTLFVTVDSSPWLSEIVRYRSKEILRRLQHSFGSDLVTRVSYRLG